jgi:hypothetical protein
MPFPLTCRGAPLALAVVLVYTSPAPAQQPADDIDLNDLSLEVSTLQTLHSLNLTEAQLRQLQTWARETVQKPRKRPAAKASKAYRAKLVELRAALLEASDGDRIDRLGEELEELRAAEKPVIDDNVDLTAAARKRAPEALRLLTVRQVIDYLEALDDDLNDPLERLLAALESIRGLKANEWKQRRDAIVDDIVWLAAGVDSKKTDKLTKEMTALLVRARGLGDADFKAKRPELEKAARKLLADLGPVDVLRNALEYSLAELLSNPRLPAVLAARLKDTK